MNTSRIHNPLQAALRRSALAVAMAAGLAASSVQALTTTATYNLGTSPSATTIQPGVAGLLPWMAKGSLPAGSILRRVTVDAIIEDVGSDLTTDDWASDLNVYLDPSPGAPGTAALLQVGGYGPIGTVSLALTDTTGGGWANGQGGPPAAVSDTKLEAAWAAVGVVDLHDVELSVGNDYSEASWSGTITVEYDVFEPAAIKSFGPGAVVGPLSGNAANIAWTVPYGTNVAALAPTFTLSSGTCNRDNGGPTTYNFSSPVVYTVTDGLTVNNYTVTVTVAAALQWNVAGGGDWDEVTSNWLTQPGAVSTTFTNGNEVFFDNAAGGTITIAPDMSPAFTTVNAASGTYTFSGGPIATGSLTKSGNGNLTITTANNTYSGGTIINAGQLKMDVQANAALGTGPVTLNGGRLFLERITATNALIVNGGNLWPDNGFGNNWNGPVTLNSNLIIQGPGYATTTFNGPIGGAGGLTINGEGPIVLAVANSYTGPTSVTACTLTCNNVDALGSGALTISNAANSKVNLNYSGTKNIAGLTLGGIAQTGGTYGSVASGAAHPSDTYFTPGSTGTVTVPPSSSKNILTFSFGVLGAATVNATTVTLEVPFGTDRTALAPTYTVSPGASGSPVSGTTLNFTGPQIYTITAEDLSTKQYSVTVTEAVLPNIFTWANAATGNWSVAANWTNEELTVTSPLAAGRTSYTLNFNAPGTYTATNNLSTGFQLNQLNLAAAASLAGNGLAFVSNGPTLPAINQNSGSALTIANDIALGSNTAFGGTGGGQVDLTGLISGAGSLTKNGTGILRITGLNNTYAGGTVINSGTLRGDIDAKAGTGPITLNGGTLYMWRFKPTNALTVNGGSITSENGFNQNQLNGPVTLNATLPVNAPFHLTCSNTISGVGGITKTGGGLMILSNTCTSTYTGPTSVTAGTVRIDRPEAVSGNSALGISGTGKMNLNYVGTKTVASLTLGGVAQTTPGTYGSVASGANFPSDTFFTTGSTGTLTVAVSDPYAAWSGGGAFAADTNNDGVTNGVAWVLGAANKEANAVGLQPLLDNTTDPTYFIYTYRRADAASADPNTTIAVKYSSDLVGWTTATAGPNVIITPTDNFYGASPGVDKVEVKINRSLAVGGKLFVRLSAVKAP